MSSERIRLGITVGDIHGIGIEIILKTFADQRMFKHCVPIIYGSSKTINKHQQFLTLEDLKLHPIKDSSKPQADTMNVIDCWTEETELNIGNPGKGAYALKALDAACADLDEGRIAGLVTAPINKEVMQSDAFKFPGHTEYLAGKFRVEECMMFMVSEQLRVGLVAGHMPVKDVASFLTVAKITSKLEIMNYSLLKDFGIEKPKIAVLGLNPHAGENGLLGSEEKELIMPAIQQANAEDILAKGPYAADTFFGSGHYKEFDGTLGMYHDQALIPFKTLSFGSGVNFTAGLNVVRTSPDHGTAYDLAGKNQASESSMRAAVFAALDIIKNRRVYHEMTSNPMVKGAAVEKEAATEGE